MQDETIELKGAFDRGKRIGIALCISVINNHKKEVEVASHERIAALSTLVSRIETLEKENAEFRINST
jgi:dUTPase